MRSNYNRWLGAIVALQGLILIGQWTGSSYLTPVQAQVPDPANRQLQMIDELKGLNAKLDRIVQIMENGDLQVKVGKPDEQKGTAPAR